MIRFDPKPMDEEQFHHLFDVLHDGCFLGNWTATARALGISVTTARKWSTTPPKRPHEAKVIELAIREVHEYMTSHRSKKIRKRANKVWNQIARGDPEKAKLIEANTHSNSGAISHLLKLISQKPTLEIDSEELFKLANMGGYNRRTLQSAAEHLQLEKETKGFGKDKITWYKLPR